MILPVEIRQLIAQSVELAAKAMQKQGIQITEGIIGNLITSQLLPPLQADDEDINNIRKQVESRTMVQHTPGIVIYDEYKRSDWYSLLEPHEEYFWERYRRFLIEEEHLDINSVNKLGEDTLINLMNSLANPQIEENHKNLVRGLVIGDVQSGKTSTYAGLICKAADSGYKVVILLTGVTETLRQQTQERMEEGIIGFTVRRNKSSRTDKIEEVGVGLYDRTKRATAFTSYDNDFKAGVTNIITSLQEYNSLVMFIVKKNTSVLNKLYNWLKAHNASPEDGLIHLPMLLIDDEADNASINTKKDKSDPTATNKVIRAICNIFNNTSYVGFTATPFANVFIDPNTPEQMTTADLFPKDFIYVLPTPSSYIGAKKIYDKDGEYHSSLRFISDINEPDEDELEQADETHMLTRPFYHGHKKEWEGELPQSLTDAIYCYLLSNVVRDLRGDSDKPRTMMINMSRYVRVQNYIKRYVEAIFKAFHHDVKYEFKDEYEDNLNHPLFIKLKSLWTANYDIQDVSLEEILDKNNILKAIDKMQIVVVNSGRSSTKLDYKKNKSIRAIAIGGLALSRGLTLKGLMTSYFYRNTATFDVLMQMGRWFGYRDQYADICRIWTSENSANWYKIISDATEELKDDLSKMFEDRLTPSEFGIKVRDESDDLQITAMNKMRSAFNHDIYFTLWGSIFETPYLSLNAKNNKVNYNAVLNLIQELHVDDIHFTKFNGGNISYAANVPKHFILDFIRSIKVNLKNIKFDTSQIETIINTDSSPVMSLWDIGFVNGDSNISIDLSEDVSVELLHRRLVKGNGCLSFAGRGSLGGTSDGKVGLSQTQIDRILKELKQENKGLRNKVWFERCQDRNPLLLIYLVRPKDLDDEQLKDEQLVKYVNELNGTPIVAFAIGFPQNTGLGASATHYKVNSTYIQQNYTDADDEE